MTDLDERPPTNNLYRSLQQLDERQTAIRSELTRLDQIDEPSDEDVAWQNTLIAEFDANEAQATPLRKRAADLRRIQHAAADPANREPVADDDADEPVDPGPRTFRSRRGAPEITRRSRRDPLADLDAVRENRVGRDELRARALDLIELDNRRYELDDDFAETASHRARKPSVAKHILLTGTPEYRDAFRRYVERAHEEGDAAFRAINLTAASGGYLLPYVLDPTIVLTNNASANPFRRIARGVNTTSNAWQGVNSAGVTAAWVSEAGTAADNSPTLGQIQIVPVKGVAWVFGSYEALDDTDFGTQLPGLLADARDRLESGSFTTGSGTSVPLGIAAALGTGSRVAPTATGTAFNGTAAIPDVYNLQAALPPRFRNSGSAGWLGNIVTINKVRSLDQYGGSAFWANLGAGTPEQLLGNNIYEGSDMNATMTGTSAASGTGSMTLLFGDWNQFIICDRVGVSMLYEPMVKGTAGSIPTGQAGWYMFWRTSSTVSTTAAFRYLTIS